MSGADFGAGIMAIKPSGVAYDDLTPDTIVPVSIDTAKPEVAEVALDLGARVLNDVTGLGETDAVLVIWEAANSTAPASTARLVFLGFP